MQVAHLRNKFVVLGFQIGLCLLLVVESHAQHFKWARRNNPEWDRRKISYGFVIGLHTTAYELKYADRFVTQSFDTVHSVQGSFSPGFSLGFLVNLRFNDVLDLRIMPKAGFYNHKLTYYYTNNSTKQQLIETTMVEFPVLLKYKSQRRGNVRMYMLGGFTPSFEASGKNDIQSTTANLSVKSRNVTLDAGFGFDFYFPLFKLSQEIRFQRGISEMLGNDASVYSAPIKHLNTNTISVYFIFQ
ncbi:MAG: porin family protein [Cyclobacteriaceae bacterium]|nr:porin family protein [Cyclobacteriaceae bacterium]